MTKKCKCGGELAKMMTVTDPKQRIIYLMGCIKCHSIYWDSDEYPIPSFDIMEEISK